MKTIAIIGAGPAGLASAKTLLRSKGAEFSVRVFEKAARVGGLWNVDKEHPHDGLLNPDMPTNISRFSVSFSDFPWQAADKADHVPYFPRAWMVGRYLQAYADRYIPSDTLVLNTRVIKVARQQQGDGQNKWRIMWERTMRGGDVQNGEELFDHLIMATGFYPEPRFPPEKALLERVSTVKQVHSTKVRSLSDMFPSGVPKAGTILIVGGGMSGADVAAVLAHQRSNAIFRPASTDKDIRAFEQVKLVQVVTAPFYALPLILPKPGKNLDKPAPDFTTLEMVLYDIGRRPPGDVTLNVGTLTPEFIEKSHRFMRGILGGNQEDLGQSGIAFEEHDKRVASTRIAEQYSEHIRAGDIRLVTGRLWKLTPTPEEGTVSAQVNIGDQTTAVDEIIGIVYATGFDSHEQLKILPQDVLQALEYDASSARMPTIIDEYYTGKIDDIPDLAFVGYHEGATWPGMELQARLIEGRWSGKVAKPNTEGPKSEHHQVLRDLRKSMAARATDVPMYALGDAVGLIESLAREVGIARNDLDWPERSGPASSVRYADAEAGGSDVSNVLDDLKDVVQGTEEGGQFVARAAFRGMHGTWRIRRQLDSFLEGFPSGKLDGTASFHPRDPTDIAYDAEYLYIEQGSFTNDQGLTFNASRRYVYRYQESSDKITAWFVKEDGKSVDYLFHELAFDLLDRRDGWTATTFHLCVDDGYRTTYLFEFAGVNIRSLQVTHAVKGPQKDYLADTNYARMSN